ncbi:hypothetical protein STEG23_006632 [Scotinomys teguina]
MIPNSEARQMIIESLTFENTNAQCKKAPGSKRLAHAPGTGPNSTAHEPQKQFMLNNYLAYEESGNRMLIIYRGLNASSVKADPKQRRIRLLCFPASEKHKGDSLRKGISESLSIDTLEPIPADIVRWHKSSLVDTDMDIETLFTIDICACLRPTGAIDAALHCEGGSLKTAMKKNCQNCTTQGDILRWTLGEGKVALEVRGGRQLSIWIHLCESGPFENM